MENTSYDQTGEKPDEYKGNPTPENSQESPEKLESGTEESKSIEEVLGSSDLVDERSEASSIIPGLDEMRVKEIEQIATTINEVKGEIGKVVVGQESILELLMVSLFVDGNVLLEGVPGIAKTLVAKMLAQTLKVDFVRIQFTPDLMPADIVGTMVYNQKSSEFEFKQGPIFSNVVLIDEINRAPAKTQAALMEVMEEKQVTIEGTTYKMSQPFFVIATQNPVEQEGTYKLPEAQMDRFIFKLKMQFPEMEDEKSILRKFKNDFAQSMIQEVQPVLNKKKLDECKRIVEQVHISEDLIDYIAKIVVATRNDGALYLGASPRASLNILKTAKAMALIRGRYFVIPEDIKYVTPHILNHRIILSHEKELEGVEPEEVIKEIIEGIEVPR